MSILKRILSGLVMFVFGLEVGGFGMWFLTIKTLKDPKPIKDPKPMRYESYESYYERTHNQ